MDITPLTSGRSLWSSSLIFVGALLDWATLVVDPSGTALPPHVIRARNREPTDAFCQTTAQQHAWQQLIQRFYYPIKARCYAAERTFAAASIVNLQAEVALLPSYESIVQHHAYPYPLMVGIHNPAHTAEDAVARHITEYMLHRLPDEAVWFLERVVLLWAAHLPNEQIAHLRHSFATNPASSGWSDATIRSYALYSYVAEPLEQ
jgi:hypothetical protein